LTAKPRGLWLHLASQMPARAAVVFAALTDPRHLAAWWGPHGFTTPGIRLELRPGGMYRFTMQPPDGEPFHLQGEYREIDAPHRLVFTFRWEEPTPDDRETIVTLSVVDLGASSRLTVDQGVFATEARRALHEGGWSDSLQRLAALLAQAPA
jgi:uncharacterized protein YndB with AHSA1/START domain